MERLRIIRGLFVAAGLCEIGGGYLVWGWMRDRKPLAWALMGALVLAAYGGVFIALGLAWGVVVDGFRPDRWDLLGATISMLGVLVMVVPTRG
jgi:small multidrug resistance family-3 protein